MKMIAVGAAVARGLRDGSRRGRNANDRFYAISCIG
jgi:hypothetical protein